MDETLMYIQVDKNVLLFQTKPMSSYYQIKKISLQSLLDGEC